VHTTTPHPDLGWEVLLAQILTNEEVGATLDEEEAAEGPTAARRDGDGGRRAREHGHRQT
jgi:hypothetical protein